MTRKSKAKQERYVVECTSSIDSTKFTKHYDSLEEALYFANSYKTLNPAIFRLVRVRSKPKSSRGGRK